MWKGDGRGATWRRRSQLWVMRGVQVRTRQAVQPWKPSKVRQACGGGRWISIEKRAFGRNVRGVNAKVGFVVDLANLDTGVACALGATLLTGSCRLS